MRGEGRSEEVLSSLRDAGEIPGARGVTHVRLEQQVDGLSVYGAYVKAAVNEKEAIRRMVDSLFFYAYIFLLLQH